MSRHDHLSRRAPWAPGSKRDRGRHRRRRTDPHPCPLCKVERRMFRRCRCGFEMCQACMSENLWGVTCNDLTWTCPDCGVQNSF